MDKFDVMEVNEKQRERIAEIEAENAKLKEALVAIVDDWNFHRRQGVKQNRTDAYKDTALNALREASKRGAGISKG